MHELSLNQLIRMQDWTNVLSLIEAGADIHVASGNGYTPLMQAAELGVIELVELLLQKGAFVNFAGRGGITPLHIAVNASVENNVEDFGKPGDECLDMIIFLLEHGADLNQKNDSGETPIHWARKTGSRKILELIDSY